MKPVRGRIGRHNRQVYVDYLEPAAEGPCVVLPIESGNVGGLEPWMVEFLSKPSPDPVLMPEHLVYVENGQWYFHIDEIFSLIAAAIAAILKEAEENLSDKVGSFDDNKEAEHES